jgi:hypothetical protein
MVGCVYHDIGGGKDMRDVIREYEWYYKGRSRRLLKFHLLITTYDDLIKVFHTWNSSFICANCNFFPVSNPFY